MSLESLREVRRHGKRPDSAVVLIGRCARIEDDCGIVQVDRRGMDLRPLVNLPVHVVDMAGNDDLTLSVLSDLQDLGATILGVCGPAGEVGSSPEHERAMWRFRESLCLS